MSGFVTIAACVLATVLVALCLRKIFYKPMPAAFGQTARKGFEFSIDSTDFRSDGSKRLPDVDPEDEAEIDRELQAQLERTRGTAAAAAHRMLDEDQATPKTGMGESKHLIGDLTSDAQLNQEAFEAEMRAELAEFDELAAEELPPPTRNV